MPKKYKKSTTYSKRYYQRPYLPSEEELRREIERDVLGLRWWVKILRVENLIKLLLAKWEKILKLKNDIKR